MKVLQRRNSTTFRLCAHARRQNSKTAVPLDAVPERRTEQRSPKFRPSDRFCKLRIRYQSLISRFEAIIQIMLCFMRYVVVLQEKKRLFQKWRELQKVPSKSFSDILKRGHLRYEFQMITCFAVRAVWNALLPQISVINVVSDRHGKIVLVNSEKVVSQYTQKLFKHKVAQILKSCHQHLEKLLAL